MKPIRPPWQSGLVLVCKKCEGNAKGDVRDALKRRLKREGLKEEVRVVGASCLDVCPKDRVTVMLCSRAVLPEMFVVGREDERRELEEAVVRMARAD